MISEGDLPGRAPELTLVRLVGLIHGGGNNDHLGALGTGLAALIEDKLDDGNDAVGGSGENVGGVSLRSTVKHTRR